MERSIQKLLVLVTAPDLERGEMIARSLVEERLAACVSVSPGLISFYRWEGKIQEDREVLLLIKTRAAKLEDLISMVQQLHPYQIPEIIALPISGGSREYLDWIWQETGDGSGKPERG